jgi:hypothetical protein
MPCVIRLLKILHQRNRASLLESDLDAIGLSSGCSTAHLAFISDTPGATEH